MTLPKRLAPPDDDGEAEEPPPQVRMSVRQRAFADHWLISGDAGRAAAAAGYSDYEPKATGARLLRQTRVNAYIVQEQAKSSHTLRLTREGVLEELARIAFSDAGGIFREDGSVKPFNHMSRAVRASISEIQIVYDSNGNANTKIKLSNKLTALDQIAKQLGFYNLDNEQKVGAPQDEMSQVEKARRISHLLARAQLEAPPKPSEDD